MILKRSPIRLTSAIGANTYALEAGNPASLLAEPHPRLGNADRARTVALDPSAQAYVERWLGRREQLGLNGRQPLFCTISKGTGFGSTLDSSYVRRALPRLAARAGLERRVHPHALRHSLATALAHEGKPLPAITAQLGHSSTAVTDRYLAKIAPADLVQQIRDRGRLDL